MTVDVIPPSFTPSHRGRTEIVLTATEATQDSDALDTLRQALVVLSVVNIVLSGISLLVEGFTPSAVVFPVLMGIGLWRLRGGGTKGSSFLAIASLVFLAVHVPFIGALLSSDCENPFDGSACQPLLWATWLGLAPLATFSIATLVWRKGSRPASRQT
jgi:hypothetical protein